MDELRTLIGVETDLDTVNAALRAGVQRIGAPVVGAHVVNCSDESQLECAQSFQREVVDQLLPELKENARTAFETRNLGARYEWGSLHVGEHHYALPASADTFKIMVVKVHGHVSALDGPDGTRYGAMKRYDTDSTACGALHGLLAGQHLPAIEDLRGAFNEGGNDRVASLLDERLVAEPYRYVYAAIANAVLQARRAVQDAQFRQPQTPTLYVVVPTVVFNRPGPDTELVCGYCIVDRRSDALKTRYLGLGDDPALYVATEVEGCLRVVEE